MGSLLAKQFSPKDLQGLALWLKADAGVIPVSSYIAGIIDNGCSFDGATSLQPSNGAGSEFAFGTNDFSVSFWVYPTSAPNNNQVIINWAIWPNTSGFVVNYGEDYFGFFLGGFEENFTYYPPTMFNVWHHIVVVRTSGTANFYVNGVNRGTANWDYDFTDGLWYIGRAQDVENYFLNGTLDEIGVWNRALSGPEVIALYNSGTGIAYPFASQPSLLSNISAYWNFNGTLNDQTTNAKNLTIEIGSTRVASWADQSGNGRNASAYNNPQLITNQINGKPVIDFNASQYFTSDNQNLNNNSSIFVVVKCRGDHGALLSTSNLEGINFYLGADPNNSIAVGVTNLAGIANDNADNGNNWMIGSTIRSNNLTSIIYKNGTQVANGDYDTSSLNPTAPLIIGTDADLNSYWNLDGQIAEIIIYNRALTISERQKVEDYLNQKYAIYTPIPNTKISIKKQNLVGGKLKTYSNLLSNSRFDKDNNYPYAGYDANYSMGGWANGGSLILSNYYHNSPVLYNINNYFTIANKTFHEINSPYNILPLGHAIQPRLLKMFGAGSKFGSLNNTNYLKTITSTTSFTPTDNQSWTKYGVEQIIAIPSWARKVKYGVKYLIISGDEFRFNNFGGLEVYFQKGINRSYVNLNMVRKPVSVDTTALDSLETLYTLNNYVNFDSAYANAMCQWLGPSTSRVKVRRKSSVYIDASNLDTFNVLSDTIDIPVFSSSGENPDYNDGFPDYISIQMFFAEWVSYLNDSGIPSGAIYFYEPFLYFTEF
jgi:hypothetical protein